ncbi:hypothetical protein FQN50_009052 [Emmonsiellopsis sp. PD_5]|nr:hypothetical protein FQN50_009052 [Emmonsiellopsis sp. PD_5]
MASSSPYFNNNNRGSRPASRASQSFPKRNGSKRNASILNFFKKSEHPPKSSQNRITDYITKSSNDKGRDAGNNDGDIADSLFLVDDGSVPAFDMTKSQDTWRERSASPADLWRNSRIEDPSRGVVDEERYNENGNSGQKRRKVHVSTGKSRLIGTSETPNHDFAETPGSARLNKSLSYGVVATSSMKRIGPFVDESDSEDDHHPASGTEPPTFVSNLQADSLLRTHPLPPPEDNEIEGEQDTDSCEQQTNHFEESSELCLGSKTQRDDDPDLIAAESSDAESLSNENMLCPICGESLTHITEREASLHVNNCLDGNAIIPSEKQLPRLQSESHIPIPNSRKTAVPRPGQRSPFTLGSTELATSAFSKIMSGNAEDSAWAAAAAKEESSRGKQSYERTCPFYKILPGFSICVDAFRYGAVEGCSAYFLSHFHSDHYIGLTSSWRHGQIYCSRVTGNLVRQQLKVDPGWITDIEFDKTFDVPKTGGVKVTMLPANHCPGSSLFLFEKPVGNGPNPKTQRILPCGDFRACPAHVQHPLLRPDTVDSVTGTLRQQRIDVCYLDTTYLNPKYAFPAQEDVVTACTDICESLNNSEPTDSNRLSGGSKADTSRGMADFLSKKSGPSSRPKNTTQNPSGRLLVVIGTYSIGKERLCVAIARSLNSKIYAPAAKQRICSCLEDEELSAMLTDNPLDAQVHMQTLMEVRAETLYDYMVSFKPRFSRVVGFRPTGWNYRPPAGRMSDSPPVSAVLYSDSWQPRFSVRDLVPQRGSNRESTYYAVPYSEHSSFRELTMFCCALRIGKIIPTVNVGSKKSRERMKLWVERWEAEKRKKGLFKVEAKAARW